MREAPGFDASWPRWAAAAGSRLDGRPGCRATMTDTHRDDNPVARLRLLLLLYGALRAPPRRRSYRVARRYVNRDRANDARHEGPGGERPPGFFVLVDSRVEPDVTDLAPTAIGFGATRRRSAPARGSSSGMRGSGSRRSTLSSAGRNRTSGATSWNTTCRTIRCMIRGIRASAATRARARCGRERTLAQAAGGRSAGCTARRRPRAEER